jgi:hypothetical protein
MRPRILPHRLALGLAALLIAFVASCSGRNAVSDPTGDLIMNFTGFGPHVGKTFYLKVVDKTNSTNVVTGTLAPRVITADAFTVELPGAVREGNSYHIDFGIDIDGNGVLDNSPAGSPAGIDQTWRITDSAWNPDLLRHFEYDTVWTDITPF